jgi:large subunit ribosomal protein L17
MRHGNKVNHLGRKTGHRKAMLQNMACSLIEHKRITTTIAKAKTLRVFIEPLINKSKTDSTHSRRVVFSYLQSKDAVTELFREVAPKIATRDGGYTRIIRTGYRLGDNAEMCMIELVDFNELYNNSNTKKTTRRSRRGGKSAEATVTATATELVEETPVAEVIEETTAAEVIKETPVADVVEETTAAEVVEETPVAEVVEETPVVEVVEETNESNTSEETPEAPATEEEKTEE